MFYFATLDFPGLSNEVLENAMRQSASKRFTIPDLKSTIIGPGEDKLFLGYEGRKALLFSRFRSSLEFVFPKIVVRLSNKHGQGSIKVRYGFFTFFVFCVLVIGLLSVIYSAFADSTLTNDWSILVVLVFLIGLTVREVIIVRKRIANAIERYKKLLGQN